MTNNDHPTTPEPLDEKTRRAYEAIDAWLLKRSGKASQSDRSALFTLLTRVEQES